MKVLMLGWEFPPYISGGLGTACYGLTKALSEQGTEIAFVLPRPVQSAYSGHVRLLTPSDSLLASIYEEEPLRRVRFCAVDVALYPYGNPAEKALPVGEIGRQAGPGTSCSTRGEGAINVPDAVAGSIPCNVNVDVNYGCDLYAQTHRYSRLACQISRLDDFDVIHAHDWMTYPAGVAVASKSGRPLVVHVHSTEFDRSGEHINKWIYDIERLGMHRADQVIAVSNFTKRICVQRYGVPDSKVSVVYNGVEPSEYGGDFKEIKRHKNEQIVLFLGRITMQKGPEYFIAAAKKVLEKMDNVKFIMAGSGDMFTRTIEMAAGMGIGHKILFAGFLRGADVDRAFEMADLYVMPSVSEPFGLSPLEAMMHNVPVIISNQSGVAEILQHALKVDFWDIDEMANKIIAVLRHPALHQTLRENGVQEAGRLRWSESARRCRQIYQHMLRTAG
ncbi:MAG: glycosyltransferase family 1 protein [Desulfobacterales bacterium]|nr:MAG: glycosyltransferase family 1 protein [Desulfobacterales bacterium]